MPEHLMINFTAMTEVILVDEKDTPLGTMEKMEAHKKGALHRAFSVFIFNDSGEMLLQQRAEDKYHNAGVWTNACCSHPAPGEDTLEAAERRLKEEMGFTTELQPLFVFTYKAEFSNGLIEHEFDHVYSGKYNGTISPNNSEVQDYGYKNFEEIEKEIEANPERYTPWFKIAFPKVKALLL
jgi:isopentenyl-diphosphate Delta-isomerase